MFLYFAKPNYKWTPQKASFFYASGMPNISSSEATVWLVTLIHPKILVDHTSVGGTQAEAPGRGACPHPYSIRTEDAYVDWVRRFDLFHDKRRPHNMDAREAKYF